MMSNIRNLETKSMESSKREVLAPQQLQKKNKADLKEA